MRGSHDKCVAPAAISARSGAQAVDEADRGTVEANDGDAPIVRCDAHRPNPGRLAQGCSKKREDARGRGAGLLSKFAACFKTFETLLDVYATNLRSRRLPWSRSGGDRRRERRFSVVEACSAAGAFHEPDRLVSIWE